MSESYPGFIADSSTSAPVHAEPRQRGGGNHINRIEEKDRSAHDWYRFVLSYPPHLVRTYLDAFGANRESVVLDPFCGTGTTIVEAKKQGVPSVGIESVPVAQFAASTKTDWSISPKILRLNAHQIAERTEETLKVLGIDDLLGFFTLQAAEGTKLRQLSPEVLDLLLKDSISPLPLHKTLVLLDQIKSLSKPEAVNHEILALAGALVQSISNLKFGPEVGIGKVKQDAPVIAPWLTKVNAMARDIEALRSNASTPSDVIWGDSRQIASLLPDRSIDIVITSPPYPNEKDYTRTTRLESVLLNFINSKEELRQAKKLLVRSNTRSVYKEDVDDQWVLNNSKIQEIARRIEERRIELGKTSGFERLYARVAKLYFGGMARHLYELQKVLRPGAQLAYVVGDQASYLRIMIQTGQILAEIAESLGYEVMGIDLFRTRAATATKSELREEVVVLRWSGRKTRSSAGNGKRI